MAEFLGFTRGPFMCSQSRDPESPDDERVRSEGQAPESSSLVHLSTFPSFSEQERNEKADKEIS